MSKFLARLPLSPARMLAPGKTLMLALPLGRKLGLLAAVQLLPLLAALAWWVADGVQAQSRMQQQMQGLQLHERLSDLGTELQTLRALGQRVLAGDSSALAGRDELRAAIGARAAGLPAALEPAATTAWADTWPRVQALLADGGAKDPQAHLAAHDEALSALALVARLNAEQTGLLSFADPTLDFPLDLLVEHLPALIEQASHLVARGSAALAGGGTTLRSMQRMDLLLAARLLDGAASVAAADVAAARRAGAAVPESWKAATTTLEVFLTQLREAFATEQTEIPVQAYYDSGKAALDALREVRQETAAALAATLQQRHAQALRQLVAASLAALAVLLLSSYLLAALFVTLKQSVVSLQRSTEAVSSGDFSATMDLPGRDELAGIGKTVNGMNATLSGLVGEIRSSAARVNMAGHQVADGSVKLSARTDEQASGLRESVAAIAQLSAAVQQNAQAARELDGITDRLAREAAEGHQAMSETIAAVTRLQDASRRVFEVVAVIDDVAFQTSMLSLNAAVEAARAGDSGKGFSVVATEVRQLAQRVGESADEIRALITQASDHLEYSGSKIGSADRALDTVAAGVQDVAARLRQIAQASTEQSDTLVSVSQRVGTLDEITRENARLVDESTAASNTLLERAQVLREAVATMRLRQGTADEARELLDRALVHVQALGTDQGLADLHDAAKGFIDRDLYVFALDRDGVYIACGAKPQLVGTSVNILPGIQGTPFVAEAWTAALAGGGWVQYEIANPLTGEVTPKESFVRQLDERLLLGCGIYRRVDPRRGDKPRAVAWSKAQEEKVVEVY
jgi:methyl-accepting chemotaxis protein